MFLKGVEHILNKTTVVILKNICLFIILNVVIPLGMILLLLRVIGYLEKKFTNRCGKHPFPS